MLRYIVVGIGSGLLFGILDGLVNANPVARKLYAVFGAISRDRINVAAGFAIDIAYGFAMAAVFLVLAPSLPGDTRLLKGLSFSLLVWVFRVVMQALSQWMMFKISAAAVLYTLLAGLAEMLAIGVLYGLTL